MSETIKRVTTLPKIVKISIKRAPVVAVEVEVDKNETIVLIEEQEPKRMAPPSIKSTVSTVDLSHLIIYLSR